MNEERLTYTHNQVTHLLVCPRGVEPFKQMRHRVQKCFLIFYLAIWDGVVVVDEDEAAGRNIVGVGAGGGLVRHSSGTGLQPCRAGTGELTYHTNPPC